MLCRGPKLRLKVYQENKISDWEHERSRQQKWECSRCNSDLVNNKIQFQDKLKQISKQNKIKWQTNSQPNFIRAKGNAIFSGKRQHNKEQQIDSTMPCIYFSKEKISRLTRRHNPKQETNQVCHYVVNISVLSEGNVKMSKFSNLIT